MARGTRRSAVWARVGRGVDPRRLRPQAVRPQPDRSAGLPPQVPGRDHRRVRRRPRRALGCSRVPGVERRRQGARGREPEQTIEYRQRWNVAGAEHALGGEPHGKDVSLQQRQAWRHATRAVGRLRSLAGGGAERATIGRRPVAAARKASMRRRPVAATTEATAEATAGDHSTTNSTTATSAPYSRWSHQAQLA